MGFDMRVQNPSGNKDADYFRFNISGMYQFAIPAMQRAGMLVNCELAGEWPKPPEDFDHVHEDWDYDPAYIAYVGQQVEAPGIPIFKFSSNDGWLVQPDECKSALDQYRKNGFPKPSENRDYWEGWIAFLRHAATHGGFRVW